MEVKSGKREMRIESCNQLYLHFHLDLQNDVQKFSIKVWII